MKKLLLSLLITTTTFVNAQVLQSENFNALNDGVIGTDITGSVAGQGGWVPFATNSGTTTNASNTTFTIKSTLSANLNYFSLEGQNGDNSGNRYMWKDGLNTSWSTRTLGNNILEFTVEINPGLRGGESKNRFGMELYNADYSKVLAGFSVNSQTGELYLIAYAQPTGATAPANYTFSLAAAPGILLAENQWSKIEVSYNYTTGQVLIKAPGTSVLGITGSASSVDPYELDFTSDSGSTSTTNLNTAATSATFDNLVVKASSASTLSVNSNVLVANENVLTIFPNPTTDVVNVTLGKTLINAISIVDLNGRVVKQNNYTDSNEVSLNVSDLENGVYFINISSENGTISRKIIKK